MLQDRRSAVLLRTAYTVSVIGIFLYFLMWQVNFYLAESIKQGIYLFFPPILLTGVLYFRKLKDGIEIKLVAAYLLWVVITRIINGDRVLSKEYLFVLDLSLMLPFMSLGLVLDRAGRRRVLNWLSVILGVYFFVLGGLCIYTFVTRRGFINPITGANISAVDYQSPFPRIAAFDNNPNVVAYWFMIPMTLMCYQFFACRSRLLKIAICLVGVISFWVISITYCRSIYLSGALCFSLLVFLLLRKQLKTGKKALVAIVLLACVLTVTPATYLGFSFAGDVTATAAEKLEAKRGVEVQPEPVSAREEVSFYPVSLRCSVIDEAASAKPISAHREKTADFDKISSGRLSIYRAAIDVLRRNPRILLVGCPADDVVELINRVLAEKGETDVVQLHNFLLQSLLLSGIMGMLLVASVCLLSAIPMHGHCFSI